MSRNNRSHSKLDLKLNLSVSPPRVNNHRGLDSSPTRLATVSPISPPSSCVSSDDDNNDNNNNNDNNKYCNSPEATSMVLVGCPRCLMYVMLSQEDPKCPKCKSTVLLDFLRDYDNNINKRV